MSTSDRWACIARMGGFGDNLIATSVFKGLKKRYDRLEVIAGEPMHVMYENNPYIDKLTVLPKDVPQWGDGHSWHKWFHDRGREYAFFANLSHSCEVTGVALKIQTIFWWPDNMRRKTFNRSYLEIVHDICDVPYEEIEPAFFPTDEERTQAAETKAKVGPQCIGWVMSGSRLDKIHPEIDVAITRILRDLKIPVIIFGAPGKDYELAKMIEAEVKKRLHTTEGLHLALSPDAANPTWGPRRICAQAQACDLVVGPDTGPMWAVASQPMPKVLLASHAGGHNITAHWKNTTTLEADRERVPCYPCHRLHDDPSTCKPNVDGNGAACISDISVDTIVSTVQHLLEEQEHGKHQRLFAKTDAGLDPHRPDGNPPDHVGNRSFPRVAHFNLG